MDQILIEDNFGWLIVLFTCIMHYLARYFLQERKPMREGYLVWNQFWNKLPPPPPIFEQLLHQFDFQGKSPFHLLLVYLHSELVKGVPLDTENV